MSNGPASHHGQFERRPIGIECRRRLHQRIESGRNVPRRAREPARISACSCIVHSIAGPRVKVSECKKCSLKSRDATFIPSLSQTHRDLLAPHEIRVLTRRGNFLFTCLVVNLVIVNVFSLLERLFLDWMEHSRIIPATCHSQRQIPL